MAAMIHHSILNSPLPRQIIRRYAPIMLLLGCIVPLVASCGLHSGAGVLAFLRSGALWTIQSDGSSPTMIAAADIAGFAWSPDHHQFVLRYGANAPPKPPQSTLGAPDSPSNLGIVSVNGGTVLQITPQDNGVLRSDAWWDPNGNRLLYREQLNGSGQPPTYFISQADQPIGIARKLVFAAATLPAIAPDGQRVAIIDATGNLRLGPPGAIGQRIATGALAALPTTNRPARILWQPHTDALLFDAASPLGVSLILNDMHGGSRALATVPALLDAAFSPDGSRLLIRTPTDFQLYTTTASDSPLFSWPETDLTALPWWSPDGRSVLVQDSTGWQQVDVIHHTVRQLLTYSQRGAPTNPGANPDWRPAATSPFSPDGSQIVFAAPASSTWLGDQLPYPHNSSTGLYIASIQSGSPGRATLIDSGADYAPGWSYFDPSTAFLVAS